MPGPTLVYLACPTRIGIKADRRAAMVKYAAEHGKAPMHPHAALPSEVYEFGIISRADTMQVCYRIIDMCDEFWVCGISEGVLAELRHFYQTGQDSSKPVVVLVDQFDPQWREYTAKMLAEHADIFEKLNLLGEIH
jgi:hypothetical protein